MATIELINTGSELMLGLVLNTHQQWLGRQLADAGYDTARQTAVPDTAADIQRAVRESLSRADFIIVTGGLGPTSDDLTREKIAELLGRKLKLDPGILAELEAFFAERKRKMTDNNRVQAQVPEGAVVLKNPNGTAPGLALEVKPNRFRADGARSWVVMLPGPPRELRPMFGDQVLPLLRREFPLAAPYACLTLRTTGIGESLVETKIMGPLQPLVAEGLGLGYCAHSGQVDVRLTARGGDAQPLVARGEAIVRELLAKEIYGVNDETLHAAVVKLLTARRETLAVAESCTGGHLANRITDVPGASEVFLGGVVTYSNAAKQEFLGVRAETLAQFGAVSQETAREMADGARERFKANYALATTGIAGPGGGTPDKPVGTVYVALAGVKNSTPTVVLKFSNRFDRETFKVMTCHQALGMLRRTLLGQA